MKKTDPIDFLFYAVAVVGILLSIGYWQFRREVLSHPLPPQTSDRPAPNWWIKVATTTIIKPLYINTPISLKYKWCAAHTIKTMSYQEYVDCQPL